MGSISIIGCGWLGLPLGKELARMGYTVKGSTTTPDKLPELAASGILPVLADFSGNVSEEALLNLLHTDEAIVTVPWSRRKTAAENIALYKLIAETLAFEGIQRALLVSSTSVYPDDLPLCLEEDADPTHPLVQAEKYFLDQIPSAVVVRFAGLIGPGRHPGKFLASRENLPAPHALVNLIHQEDAIGVIAALMEQKREGIYNACSPMHPERAAFYTEASRRLGIEAGHFDSSDTSTGREISCVRLLEDTGYVFRHEDLYAALDHC